MVSAEILLQLVAKFTSHWIAETMWITGEPKLIRIRLRHEVSYQSKALSNRTYLSRYLEVVMMLLSVQLCFKIGNAYNLAKGQLIMA